MTILSRYPRGVEASIIYSGDDDDDDDGSYNEGRTNE